MVDFVNESMSPWICWALQTTSKIILSFGFSVSIKVSLSQFLSKRKCLSFNHGMPPIFVVSEMLRNSLASSYSSSLVSPYNFKSRSSLNTLIVYKTVANWFCTDSESFAWFNSTLMILFSILFYQSKDKVVGSLNRGFRLLFYLVYLLSS